MMDNDILYELLKELRDEMNARFQGLETRLTEMDEKREMARLESATEIARLKTLAGVLGAVFGFFSSVAIKVASAFMGER